MRKFTNSANSNIILENHGDHETVVCSVADGASNLKNKNLILSAPDMLEALEACYRELCIEFADKEYAPVERVLKKAEKAIKQAKGE